MMRMRSCALTGALALAVVAAPSAAWAEDDTSLGNEAGLGALSALSTLIYGPAKLTYATLGLVFGGIAWGLAGGDQEVLDAVVTASVRGDYVVTPSHLRMEEGLEFYGQDPRYREIQHAAVDESTFYEEDY